MGWEGYVAHLRRQCNSYEYVVVKKANLLEDPRLYVRIVLK
jgi:hypothetical protein